jgi:SAM-dependent methyltransferase
MDSLQAPHASARHKLFDKSACYADCEPLAAGFYDLELPHGFRWIGREARCLLPVENPKALAQPLLELVLHSNPFGWTPCLSVFVNDVFVGTQAIASYGHYYFPLDLSRLRLTETLAITLRANHAQPESGAPDARQLSLPVYDIALRDLERDEGFEERRLFLQQMQLFACAPLPDILDAMRHRDDLRVLELGAGGGWMTFLLAARTGGSVVGVDICPYLETTGNGFKPKLAEQLARHLGATRLAPGFGHVRGAEDIRRVLSRSCEFYTMDATDLLLRDASFDLVVSVNAFEHIARPDLALGEIRRVLKPGGQAFLCFSPLYHCDSGSHLRDCGLLDAPWAHLLHDRDDLKRMTREAGRPDTEVDAILDSLNRWTPGQFDKAIANCGLGVADVTKRKGFTIPGAEQSPEFALAKQKYPIDDLTTIGMTVHLAKKR